MSNVVYLVVVEFKDGHKSVVSHDTNYGFMGDITEEVFDEEKALQVLAENQKYYASDITVKQIYLKAVEL